MVALFSPFSDAHLRAGKITLTTKGLNPEEYLVGVW